jgi:hypothetical protein
MHASNSRRALLALAGAAAALPSPSFNTRSDVLSLVQPQPQLERNFASIHHCAFWGAG